MQLPHATATQHIHRQLPHVTVTRHSHTTHPQATDIRNWRTPQPHTAAAHHSHTSQLCVTATRHSYTSQPHVTATRHSHTPQPHVTATHHTPQRHYQATPIDTAAITPHWPSENHQSHATATQTTRTSLSGPAWSGHSCCLLLHITASMLHTNKFSIDFTLELLLFLQLYCNTESIVISNRGTFTDIIDRYVLLTNLYILNMSFVSIKMSIFII